MMRKTTFARKIACFVLLLMAGTISGIARNPVIKSYEIKAIKALPFLMEKNHQEFQPVVLKATGMSDSCKVIVSAEGNDRRSCQLVA